MDYSLNLDKSENCADEVRKLLPGFHETLPNTTEVPSLPHWANIEKVKKGQQFGLKYLYGLNYSQTLSLLFLFAPPEGLKPLIFTEKSHTPYLAHKRYLSTALKVKSWYETEFWKCSTLGYANLKTVKSLHLDVAKRLDELTADKVEKRCDLEEKLNRFGFSMLCPLQCVLNAEFKKKLEDGVSSSARLFDVHSDGVVNTVENEKTRVYFNQFDMGMTQFGFFGLMLIYPEKFAARNATEEELECFVHMWRLLGYFLGIKDQYNFCEGDLSVVKERSRQLIEYTVKPLITQLHDCKDWEHMVRCAYQGIEMFTKLRISFESTLLYLCWILNIPTPVLSKSIGWQDLLRFHVTKFVMTIAHFIPGFTKLFNYRITRTIERAQLDLNTR